MTGEWLPPKPPGGDEPLPGPPPEYPQQPPPGYFQPPQARPPQQPPNNDAVAGFTCGIIGVSLLFFTGGLSTIVSLVLGIVAIPYSRKGKQNVEEGRTPKHKSLASAGFVIGIVTIVLSVLATITWILIFTLVDWDEIDDEDDDPFNDFDRTVLLRVVAAAVRLVA
jgi:heme/copper-type cytochrome/quinol oxidase subunit 2